MPPLCDAGTARRKVVPETLERRVLEALAGRTQLFRKTSCAVSYVHELPDYNGHYGVRELCDICPVGQIRRCSEAHQVPTAEQLIALASSVLDGEGLEVLDITDRAAVVAGLSHEQPRYFLQHALGFQIHDVRRPHLSRRHGRADIGWTERAAS